MFLSGSFSKDYWDSASYGESDYCEDMEINQAEPDYTDENFDFKHKLSALFQSYIDKAAEREKCKAVPLAEFVFDSIVGFCDDIDRINADTVEGWYKVDDWDEETYDEEPCDSEYAPKDIKLSVDRGAIDRILQSIASGDLRTDWYLKNLTGEELCKEDIKEIIKQLASTDYIYKMTYDNILHLDDVLAIKVHGKDFQLSGGITANDVMLYIKAGDSDGTNVTLLSVTCSKEPRKFPHSSAKARSSFNHYCKGKGVTTPSNIIYDFTERKDYLDYEEKISDEAAAARDNPDLFIKDLLNTFDILTAFEKLFYENKTLVFALSCRFSIDDDNYYGGSEPVRICICPSKENHTKNYSGRTMDFLIQTANGKTVALFPIDRDILKAGIDEIISQTSENYRRDTYVKEG